MQKLEMFCVNKTIEISRLMPETIEQLDMLISALANCNGCMSLKSIIGEQLIETPVYLKLDRGNWLDETIINSIQAYIGSTNDLIKIAP